MKKLLLYVILFISSTAFCGIDHHYEKLYDQEWHFILYSAKDLKYTRHYQGKVLLRMKRDGSYEEKTFSKVITDGFKNRLEKDGFLIYNWHKTGGGPFSSYRVEFSCDDFIHNLFLDSNIIGIEYSDLTGI